MQTFQVKAWMRKQRLCFSPDGRYLSVGTIPHTLLDTAGGPPASVGDDGHYQWGHCFVRGGTACAFVSHSRELAVHDLRTGEEVRWTPDGLNPRDVIAGPGGDTLFLAGGVQPRNRSVEIWEVDAHSLARRSAFARHGRTLGPFVAAADGSRLATGDDWVRVWDLRAGNRPAKPVAVVKHRGYLLGFDLTADGARLAVADSYALSLWDTESGERVAHSGKHRRTVTTVACCPAPAHRDRRQHRHRVPVGR